MIERKYNTDEQIWVWRVTFSAWRNEGEDHADVFTHQVHIASFRGEDTINALMDGMVVNGFGFKIDKMEKLFELDAIDIPFNLEESLDVLPK